MPRWRSRPAVSWQRRPPACSTVRIRCSSYVRFVHCPADFRRLWFPGPSWPPWNRLQIRWILLWPWVVSPRSRSVLYPSDTSDRHRPSCWICPPCRVSGRAEPARICPRLWRWVCWHWVCLCPTQWWSLRWARWSLRLQNPAWRPPGPARSCVHGPRLSWLPAPAWRLCPRSDLCLWSCCIPRKPGRRDRSPVLLHPWSSCRPARARMSAQDNVPPAVPRWGSYPWCPSATCWVSSV